uniref:Uncharacterized protein n=1 Tax=Helianthus annuus TaxID=4232 RepID=A0A251SVD4_HELAN
MHFSCRVGWCLLVWLYDFPCPFMDTSIPYPSHLFIYHLFPISTLANLSPSL